MFAPSKYIDVSHLDLLSYTFGNPPSDCEKPILIDAQNDSVTISYAQAKSIVRKLIAGLKAQGFGPGNTLCVHSFNSVYYVLLYLAVIGSGGRFLGANPAYTTSELNETYDLCRVTYVVVERELLANVLPSTVHGGVESSHIFIFNSSEAVGIYPSWEALLCFGEMNWASFDDETKCKTTIAALMSTSGTTGAPKAAEISHHALIAQMVTFHDFEKRPYEIRRLLCLPEFHSFNSALAFLAPIRAQNITYLMKRYNSKQFIECVERHKITEAALVNPILFDLIAATPKGKKHPQLDSLRFVWSGGVPLSALLQNRFCRILHRDAIVSQVYGMTENSGWITSTVYPERDNTGCAGKLLPNIEARVVDENMNDLEDENGTGELLVRSPSLMTGYLDNPEATNNSFVNGWLRTGDIAYQRDGKWYIVDRTKELIKVRGWQVSPVEIETCLLGHPAIADVAVVGIMASEEAGELPRAYVVLRPSHADSVTDEDIASHLKGRLANYKKIAGGVRRLDVIPRNASGKILRKVLRELAKNESAADIEPRNEAASDDTQRGLLRRFWNWLNAYD